MIASTSANASNSTDASAEFRSEFAALLAYYAARIAAARRALPASEVVAAVQAILNEQTVALRALAERQAPTQKRRDEKPERPTGIAQRKNEGPKPS
jgi:aminoglycoside phosphotransferase (APT) family kinase protein